MAKEVEKGSFAELCKNTKSSVYLIARVRPVRNNGVSLVTLGTGFLCGAGRMLTCAHVMDGEGDKHKEGDKYLLIQKDEFGNFHRSQVTLKRNKDLFIYEDIDAAILYLPDSFYDGRNSLQHLKLSSGVLPLGEEVGVFGYPLQKIDIVGDDIDLTPISIRVDKGVLNLGDNQNGININEFTMAFNPGNSGGPILDCSTGKVASFVQGYKSVPTRFVRELIPEPFKTQLGADHVITAIRALYSVGICTSNLLPYKDQHKLDID